MIDADLIYGYIHNCSWCYLRHTEWQRSWNFRFVDNLFNFGKDFH